MEGTRGTKQSTRAGIALPMTKHIERTMLARCQRLPGLRSHLTGLESHMGLDEKLEYLSFVSGGAARCDLGHVLLAAEYEHRRT